MSNLPDNHDHDIEQSLIGGLITNPFGLDGALATGLDSDDFYQPQHKLIFAAMCALKDRGVALDIATLVDELNQGSSVDDAGGLSYLLSLPNIQVGKSVYVAESAAIVHRMSNERRLAEEASNLVEAIGSRPKTLDYEARKIYELMGPLVQGLQAKAVHSEMKAVYERILGRITGDMPDDTVIRTDIIAFNKLLQGGLRRTDFVVIAGRTGQGKSAIATTIAHHVAVVDKLPCVIYSYEMSPEQVASRILSVNSEIALTKIREGNITNPNWLARLTESMGLMADAPLEIVSASGQTIDDIKADVLARQRHTDIALVIIDYLQLVDTPSDLTKASRATQVAYTTAHCKKLAEQANVCVLGLSQLNRGVEIRSDAPMLSDLRESGAIEQDANQVLFVYDSGDQDSMPDGFKLKVLDLQKNRNGEVGMAEVPYRGAFTRFVNTPTVIVGDHHVA